MSNQYFSFKQFTIWQDQCAMKVCTDSCIFGATLPTLNERNHQINKVLDVGAGTGLLSLMYAQLNEKCTITAIEIEPNAAKQAKKNIEASKFANKITLLATDFFDYNTETNFDLIICNPPFYEHDLKSPDKNRNLAHHSAQFNLSQF